jgi:hypothetical protein
MGPGSRYVAIGSFFAAADRVPLVALLPRDVE